MIHVDKDAVAVTGPAIECMAQLGMLIANMAASLTRRGADRKVVKAFFHSLVDISFDAPESGTTIDLGFFKED